MKKVIITIIETNESFTYSLPFEYKGVTYMIDIYENLVAIEQEFESGEWRCQDVYVINDYSSIFKIEIN